MDYKSVSDIELWKCCRQDDIRAYNELVARYIPRLGKLTHRFVKDTFKTEELIMDLLFNLWERRHTLEIKDSVSAYLYTSFKYMALRQLCKSLPHTIDITKLDESIQPSDIEADYRIRYAEAENDFDSQLKQLTPQVRVVFEMSRTQNLSNREIAQRMNLSVRTVEGYISVALSHMRKHYNDYAYLAYLVVLGNLYK